VAIYSSEASVSKFSNRSAASQTDALSPRNMRDGWKELELDFIPSVLYSFHRSSILHFIKPLLNLGERVIVGAVLQIAVDTGVFSLIVLGERFPAQSTRYRDYFLAHITVIITVSIAVRFFPSTISRAHFFQSLFVGVTTFETRLHFAI
jgi:hypothetical protein